MNGERKLKKKNLNWESVNWQMNKLDLYNTFCIIIFEIRETSAFNFLVILFSISFTSRWQYSCEGISVQQKFIISIVICSTLFAWERSSVYTAFNSNLICSFKYKNKFSYCFTPFHPFCQQIKKKSLSVYLQQYFQ